MVFGLFKKTDPICGMKEEKGKGMKDEKTGNWFCSDNCKKEFDTKLKAQEKSMKDNHGCCH